MKPYPQLVLVGVKTYKFRSLNATEQNLIDTGFEACPLKDNMPLTTYNYDGGDEKSFNLPAPHEQAYCRVHVDLHNPRNIVLVLSDLGN